MRSRGLAMAMGTLVAVAWIGSLGSCGSADPRQSISGTVTGPLGQGVRVTLAGAGSATTTTDERGRYVFFHLDDGSYTVTPVRPGYTFDPAARTVTLRGADVAGRDFTAASKGRFLPTGDVLSPRHSFTATLLPNGKVLLVGGEGDAGPLSSAELYDPVTGTFAATRGGMAVARQGHTATLLLNGKVLIAGGGEFLTTDSVQAPPGAELYDPGIGTFSAAGSMSTGRMYPTATQLPDGRVLVAGGWSGTAGLASAEIYDPQQAKFSRTEGELATTRGKHTATLLPDGRVLLTGGIQIPRKAGQPDQIYLASAELYDPGTGKFAPAGTMGAPHGRHTATLLLDGTVLIVGAANTDNALSAPHAEVYDPAARTFRATANMPTPRYGHSVTLLLNGQVLVAGGLQPDTSSAPSAYAGSALLYDTDTRTFSATGSISVPREWHTATLLLDGTVLIAGGFGEQGPSSAADLYAWW